MVCRIDEEGWIAALTNLFEKEDALSANNFVQRGRTPPDQAYELILAEESGRATLVQSRVRL